MAGSDLYPKFVIPWCDDLLGHFRDVEMLLQTLDKLLRRCASHNFYLNLARCVFYTLRAKFAGKVYSADDIQHDPERLHALGSMPEPTKGDELYQFISGAQWISYHISNAMLHLSGR